MLCRKLTTRCLTQPSGYKRKISKRRIFSTAEKSFHPLICQFDTKKRHFSSAHIFTQCSSTDTFVFFQLKTKQIMNETTKAISSHKFIPKKRILLIFNRILGIFLSFFHLLIIIIVFSIEQHLSLLIKEQKNNNIHQIKNGSSFLLPRN